MQNYLNLIGTPGWSLNKGLESNPYNRPDDSLRRAVGDVDGDGRAELVFNSSDGSTLGVFSYLLWNDLTANPPYNLTYLQNAWQSAGPGPMVQMLFEQGNAPVQTGASGNAWNFNAGDYRLLADFNGDGTDEILIFDSDDLWIGVCSWSNSDSQVEALWSAPNQIPAATPGGPTWQLRSDDVFFAGRFLDGGTYGTYQILVYRPSTAEIGVLAWSSNSLVTLWTGASTLKPAPSRSGVWDLGPKDQFFSARNLGGPSLDLIVVANANSGQIGVLQYLPSGLSVLSAQSGTGWGGALTADVDGDTRDEFLTFAPGGEDIDLTIFQWLPANGQMRVMASQSISFGVGPYQLIPGRFSRGPQTELLLFAANSSGNPSNLAIVSWVASSSSLELTWQGTFQNSAYWVPGSQQVVQTGQVGWWISAADQYFCADIDGDGADEIVVFNPTTLWIGWMKLISGALMLQNDASGAVPGWNPALLTSAPANPFQPFAGVQQDIYSYLSGYAITGEEDNSGNDIRKLYPNENDVNVYAAWIANLVNPPNRDHWPPDIFEDMRTRLHAELNGVAELYGMISFQTQVNTTVALQQMNDYIAVANNINVAPLPESQLDYWLSSIFDAVIWGLGAAGWGEDEVEAGIGLAVLASLYGSALGDNTPTEVTPDQGWTTVWPLIQLQYDKAIASSLTQQQQFLGDSVILPVLWGLLNSGWIISGSTLNNVISQRAQDADQLYFYQLLMPLTFELLIWKNTTWQEPFIWQYENVSLGAPAGSYLTMDAGNGLYDIYLVCAGAELDSENSLLVGSGSAIEYPAPALISALSYFENTYQSSIFLQTAGWSMPTYYVNWNTSSMAAI